MDTAIETNIRRKPIAEDAPTDVLIAWTLDRFSAQRIIMTTSFGMEGCALIDMYARFGQPITVVYLDTMLFFPETYRLRDHMVERYPHLNFVNRGTSLTPEQQAEKYGEELWKQDPDQCCQIRKVDPMFDVMVDVDVWITGLRRSQSSSRANLRVVDWDWKYQVLKISPLAAWERPQIWEYTLRHDVPYNELHERGYPTIGCTHCTKAVPGSTPADYTRTGRWNSCGKTECGLHHGAGI
jgi:phosphoadenosine phosphosulfate reductase